MKKKITQSELVLRWLKSHKNIIPAKMTGRIYCNTMFGSEISRCCRRLRSNGILESTGMGRFEVYKRKE